MAVTRLLAARQPNAPPRTIGVHSSRPKWFFLARPGAWLRPLFAKRSADSRLKPANVGICPATKIHVCLGMKIKYLWPLLGLLLTGCATTRTTTVSAPPPGPSLAGVQSMVAAGVSDSVIVNQIQNSSTVYTLTADQIIALKNAGVSEAVLNALINSVSKIPVQTTAIAEEGPDVYPYVYVDPWPWPFWGWWGWGPYYHGGYYRGYHHGGGYHGGGSPNLSPTHVSPPQNPPHINPPHINPPHGNPPHSGGSPHGSPPRSGGGTRGGGNSNSR